MAMHRRPPSAKPPAELVTFDPEDWPHGPGEPADVTWYPSFQRWCEARRAWLAEHPESDALWASPRIVKDFLRPAGWLTVRFS